MLLLELSHQLALLLQFFSIQIRVFLREVEIQQLLVVGFGGALVDVVLALDQDGEEQEGDDALDERDLVGGST